MEEQLSVSTVRARLKGIHIRHYPPDRQKDVQKLRELIQDLLQLIGRDEGLAIGTEHYEDLWDDFSKLNFLQFEQEVVLNPAQTRLFRRIEELLAQLKTDPRVQFSSE